MTTQRRDAIRSVITGIKVLVGYPWFTVRIPRLPKRVSKIDRAIALLSRQQDYIGQLTNRIEKIAKQVDYLDSHALIDHPAPAGQSPGYPPPFRPKVPRLASKPTSHLLSNMHQSTIRSCVELANYARLLHPAPFPPMHLIEFDRNLGIDIFVGTAVPPHPPYLPESLKRLAANYNGMSRIVIILQKLGILTAIKGKGGIIVGRGHKKTVRYSGGLVKHVWTEAKLQQLSRKNLVEKGIGKP